MHDDTTSSNQTEQSQQSTPVTEKSALDQAGPECFHTYHEVSGDLLSKPNLLCDLLEAENLAPSVIFCNSPSDADFIEVILKKRGIPSRKLIGHVPPGKVSESLQSLREGKLCALVMTDVSAESLNGDCFKFVINYTVPTDPDTYLERIARACAKAKEASTVISLIGPLDISNFHYIKKLVGSEFKKIDAPAMGDLLKRRAEALLKTARQSSVSDERLAQIAAIILDDSELFDAQAKKDLLVYLLNLSVNANQNAGASREERSGRQDRDGRRSQSRDRRPSRNSRGRDGDRDSDYEDTRDDYERSDDRFGGQSRGGGENRGRSRSGAPQRPSVKELRYYLGHGQKDGFSQDELVAILNQVSSDTFKPDLLKRFTLRELYSFVDFPEEQAQTFFDALSSATRSNKEPLFICKATSIYPPRANDDESDSDEESPRSRSNVGFNDSEEDEGRRAGGGGFEDE